MLTKILINSLILLGLLSPLTAETIEHTGIEKLGIGETSSSERSNKHWTTLNYDISAGRQLNLTQSDIDARREPYWEKVFANTDYSRKYLDADTPEFSKIRRHFRFKWLWRVGEKKLRTQYTELLHMVLEGMRVLHKDEKIRDLNLVLYRQLLGEVNRQISEPPGKEDWNPQFRDSIVHEVENGPGYKQRREIIRADDQAEKNKAKKAYEEVFANHYRDYYSHSQPAVKWSETAHMLIPAGTIQWPLDSVDRQFVSKADHNPVQIAARSQLIPGVGNLIESNGVFFSDRHSIENLRNLPLHCIRNGFIAIKKMIAGDKIDVERLVRATDPVWQEWPTEIKQEQISETPKTVEKTELNIRNTPTNSKFYTKFDESQHSDHGTAKNTKESTSSPEKLDLEPADLEKNVEEKPNKDTLFAGFRRHIVKTKWGKRVVDEIADIDIRFNIKLFDLDLYEGVGIGSKYRYEVEPSYVDNYYTRVDTWRMNANVRPGDLLSDDSLPFGLNIEKGQEVHFVRQFKSKSRALKAIPYSFKHFPYNSERIIDNLHPGDFVAIPAHLNLVIGKGIGTLSNVLTGAVSEYFGLNAGLNASYLLSGKFQLHIFKMMDNRVRLRILAQRQQKISMRADAQIGFLGTGLDFFLISLVDKQIRKWTRVKLTEAGADKEFGRIFLADYVFNLNNSAAREALDGILASQFKLRETEIINPFNGKDKPISNKMIHDLSLIEELVQEDKADPIDSRRINRLYRGESVYNRHTRNLRVGIKIIQYGRQFHRTENLISHVDENNKTNYYLYPTFTRNKEFEALFGIFKHSNMHTVYSLFPSDREGVPSDFGEWGTTWEFRDKRFSGEDQEKIIKFVARNLPTSVLKKIPWGQWKDIKSRVNARMRFHTIFEKYAFDQISEYNLFELFQKFKEFKTSIPTMPKPRTNRVKNHRNTAVRNFSDWYERHKKQIGEMLEGIYLISRPEVPAKERMKGLEDLLKNNEVFRLLGTGYLMSLLNEESQQKGTFVQFELYAKDTKAIRFQHGGQNNAHLRELLLYINNVLNNRNFDIRLHPTDLDEVDALRSSSQ